MFPISSSVVMSLPCKQTTRRSPSTGRCQGNSGRLLHSCVKYYPSVGMEVGPHGSKWSSGGAKEADSLDGPASVAADVCPIRAGHTDRRSTLAR